MIQRDSEGRELPEEALAKRNIVCNMVWNDLYLYYTCLIKCNGGSHHLLEINGRQAIRFGIQDELKESLL